VLLLQHPVLVLVFKQLLCHCLTRWLGQETALWTTVSSVSGCSSPAAYWQSAALAGFMYLKFTEGSHHTHLLQWRVLQAGYWCRLCLFKVHTGNCSSPPLWHIGYCCRLCLFKGHMGDCPSPFSSVFEMPPLLLHALFSSLFIIQVFFLPRVEVSLSRGAMPVYPRGGCGSTTCHLFAHLLVCISQAG
jgi:hypothetical protein